MGLSGTDVIKGDFYLTRTRQVREKSSAKSNSSSIEYLFNREASGFSSNATYVYTKKSPNSFAVRKTTDAGIKELPDISVKKMNSMLDNKIRGLYTEGKRTQARDLENTVRRDRGLPVLVPRQANAASSSTSRAYPTQTMNPSVQPTPRFSTNIQPMAQARPRIMPSAQPPAQTTTRIVASNNYNWTQPTNPLQQLYAGRIQTLIATPALLHG